MIYLIESGEYYKIGYTQDLDKRLKQYATHNPNIKLIDSQDGDTKDENNLHYMCKPFLVENEWFKKDPEILKIWKVYNKYIKPQAKLKERLSCKESFLLQHHKSEMHIYKCNNVDKETSLEILNFIDIPNNSDIDIVVYSGDDSNISTTTSSTIENK